MKERPILFSGAMVRALLDGRKTQTRRVVKLNDAGRVKRAGKQWHIDDPAVASGCPYGVPGDRLWVRETWSHAKALSSELFYRATDGEQCSGRQLPLSYIEREARWRPSIHMPRWASRITLEVTGVRVERLQDITADDARAEGVFTPEAHYAQNGPTAPISNFAGLWADINGWDSWNANPWVWCVSFRRLPP